MLNQRIGFKKIKLYLVILFILPLRIYAVPYAPMPITNETPKQTNQYAFSNLDATKTQKKIQELEIEEPISKVIHLKISLVTSNGNHSRRKILAGSKTAHTEKKHKKKHVEKMSDIEQKIVKKTRSEIITPLTRQRNRKTQPVSYSFSIRPQSLPLENLFTPPEVNYINSLQMSDRQKAYLIEFLTTPVGQEVLYQRMLHPLVGPTASNILSPVAFGLPSGVMGMGGYVVNRWPGVKGADGLGVVGLGLGNADKYIGVEIFAIIDSLGVRSSFSPNSEPFGRNGTTQIQAFRWLGPNTAVAIGSANATGWGAFRTYNPSYYAVGTQIFNLNPAIPDYPVPLTVSAGAGTGAFVSPIFFTTLRNNNQANFFANAGLRVLPRMSLIADYSCKIISGGISFIPTYYLPINVTLFALNLGGDKFPGGVTYGLSASMGFKIF
jgi:hypothetical protein